MLLANTKLIGGVIVPHTYADAVIGCLFEDTVISNKHQEIMIIHSRIFTEEGITQVGRDPDKKYAIFSHCIFKNCELPNAVYELNLVGPDGIEPQKAED